jgi:hypothetical protein
VATEVEDGMLWFWIGAHASTTSSSGRPNKAVPADAGRWPARPARLLGQAQLSSYAWFAGSGTVGRSTVPILLSVRRNPR